MNATSVSISYGINLQYSRAFLQDNFDLSSENGVPSVHELIQPSSCMIVEQVPNHDCVTLKP